MRIRLLCLTGLLCGTVVAQPRPIKVDLPATHAAAFGVVETGTDVPRVIHGTDYRASGGDPLEMARDFLNARAASLKLEGVDLQFTSMLRTPGGSRVRFQQVIGGLPVFGSDVVISLAQDGRVAFVVNNARPGLSVPAAGKAGGMAASQATAVARDYLGVRGTPRTQIAETVIFPLGRRGVIAHRVDVVAPGELAGDWRVVVDAADGEVLFAENRAPGHRGGDRSAASKGSGAAAPALTVRDFNAATSRRTDASGWVFDPDPLSRAGADYGGDFVDADDADSQALTDQLVEVTLKDVTFDGTTYLLEGPYARIVDAEAPTDGVFSQATPDFHFTRADSSFEAVNVYHHLDQSLRYINETLGFALKPYQFEGGVLFDPHGWDGDDQSSYSLSEGLLSFGEGGVDDGEDVDVILHELGHGMHDWLTNGGLSQVDGLSEGSGDYWANSYHRSLNVWDSSQAERAWVFHWDGHNEFFSGRTTDYGAHYPDGLIDQIHTDGQIWASALMEIWEQLGRETTDKLFLEALSMTGSTSSQADAAFAFMSADSLLNGAANSDVIRDVFLRRGYLLRANFDASKRAGVSPVNVAFFDASFAAGGGITSWEWDLDGDGVTDATAQSPQWVYTDPGLYTVTLTVSDGAVQTTKTLEDFVSVNEGIYLWQGGRNQFDRSGDYMRNHFLVRGLTNGYSNSTSIHAPLAGYDAVFLSLGAFSTGPTELDASMADALRTYLRQGGQVYLEGSEALGFDQASSTSFLALFGLASSTDGASAATPVQNMVGGSSAITQGMAFTGSSQVGTTWIDTFEPQAPAVAGFVESGYGTVAVQNEPASGGKTFAMSYALGHLEDGSSSRSELLDRILEWFGFSFVTGVDTEGLPAAFALEPVFPNPASGSAQLRYMLPAPAEVFATVYDALGRRVLDLASGDFQTAGSHQLQLNASALPSGAYFVRLTAGERVARQSLLVIR
jgi:PKD repeat protein